MNLDLLPIGWIHSVACVIALIAAPFALGTRKGSRRHIAWGRAYVVSMIVLSVTALGIYRIGTFFFPHMLALVTLAAVLLGWGAARIRPRRGVWRHAHLSGMIVSYYLLIGGGVNEAYLRIHALQDLLNTRGAGLLGLTHQIVLAAFVVLLVGWNAVEVVRRRPRMRRPVQAGAES